MPKFYLVNGATGEVLRRERHDYRTLLPLKLVPLERLRALPDGHVKVNMTAIFDAARQVVVERPISRRYTDAEIAEGKRLNAIVAAESVE